MPQQYKCRAQRLTSKWPAVKGLPRVFSFILWSKAGQPRWEMKRIDISGFTARSVPFLASDSPHRFCFFFCAGSSSLLSLIAVGPNYWGISWENNHRSLGYVKSVGKGSHFCKRGPSNSPGSLETAWSNSSWGGGWKEKKTQKRKCKKKKKKIGIAERRSRRHHIFSPAGLIWSTVPFPILPGLRFRFLSSLLIVAYAGIYNHIHIIPFQTDYFSVCHWISLNSVFTESVLIWYWKFGGKKSVYVL